MPMDSNSTLRYLIAVMDRFGQEREKYSEFLQIFMDFNKKVDGDEIIRRSKELFGGNERMVMGFFNLLLDQKRKTKKPDDFGEAFQFVYIMMQKSHNSRANACDSTADYSDPEQKIMQGHAEMDRMEDSNLTGHERNEKYSGHNSRKLDGMIQHAGEKGGNSASVSDHENIMTESSWNEEHMNKFVNAENRDRFGEQNIDERKKARKLKRERDKRNGRFDKELPSIPRNVASQNCSFSSKNENNTRDIPISQLDLSNCRSCTPSYRLLPAKLIEHCSNQGTEPEEEPILNDSWVSVYYGRDFSAKKANEYEQILFRCEDDMFELDMLLGLVKATVNNGEKILLKFLDDRIKSSFNWKECFTSSNLHCIKQFYVHNGIDILDSIEKDPTLELPRILSNLKRWEKYLKILRINFHEVCRGVFAKNNPKLHDNGSITLKQRGLKRLRMEAKFSNSSSGET